MDHGPYSHHHRLGASLGLRIGGSNRLGAPPAWHGDVAVVSGVIQEGKPELDHLQLGLGRGIQV